MKDGFAGQGCGAEEMKGAVQQSHGQKMRFKQWKARGVVNERFKKRMVLMVTRATYSSFGMESQNKYLHLHRPNRKIRRHMLYFLGQSVLGL